MELLDLLYKNLNKIKMSVINFFRNTFEATTTKKLKTTGLVVGAVTFLIVLIFSGQFISMNNAGRWYMLSGALILPMLIGLSIAYTIRFRSEKVDRVYQLLSLFIMPFFGMAMTEALNGVFIFQMKPLAVLGNYIIILMLYFIVFALCGSLRVAFLSINTVIFGLGVAHCYIMAFRGDPFVPNDFWAISTAAGVANTYNFAPPGELILSSLIFIFLTVYAIKTKTPKYKLPTKIISRVATGTFTVALVFIYFGTSILVDLGVVPYFWNINKSYKDYGFVFNFFSNTRYLWYPKPDGYDDSKIKEHTDNVIDQDEYIDSNEMPNIICIMNESLSDLKILGDFETNKDYMPYMRSLTKNTIKGYCYVPVIGGGTSNTEFEFLTGHSMAFLPTKSNAYTSYIKNPLASLVSTLKAQNYSSYAFHPYYASGWKRTEIYGRYGFDKFDSIEDMMDENLLGNYQENGSNPDYLQQYIEENYPDKKNMLIRQYVSDSYDYDWLIKDFKNRDKHKPYFAFNVTMQNHGGYTTASENFKETIYTTSLSRTYPKVNQYLSLVKRSDNAFKKLIKYFEKVEEPTVICMFGDHHPTVENEFLEEVLGVSNITDVTLEQEQQRHATPFFIWANYDIEEEYIEKISVNYLSSLVLKTAGVKLTEYNKYLLSLYKKLPVIDTVGYIDADGVYYDWNDKSSPYKDLLDDYKRIQYNNISDQENVDKGVFYLNGYVHEGTVLDEEEIEEK